MEDVLSFPFYDTHDNDKIQPENEVMEIESSKPLKKFKPNEENNVDYIITLDDQEIIEEENLKTRIFLILSTESIEM